jgi:Holliday junction DNA helicase RuvA
MISYLKGNLIHKSPEKVTIDVGGVGYCALIPLSTYFKLGELNEPVELLVYTHLTDNALSLYGFYAEDEREIFMKLISISGIGPKLALNTLSGIGPTDLKEAVKKNDVARISLIPGIGKKTALRIALELQEKIEKKEKLLATKDSKEKEDLISALTNLGFKRREVEITVNETIKSFSSEAGFEKLLRECLKKMAKI